MPSAPWTAQSAGRWRAFAERVVPRLSPPTPSEASGVAGVAGEGRPSGRFPKCLVLTARGTEELIFQLAHHPRLHRLVVVVAEDVAQAVD